MLTSSPPPSIGILSPNLTWHRHPLLYLQPTSPSSTPPIVAIVFFSAISILIIRILDRQWIHTWNKVHNIRLLNSKYIGGDEFQHGLFW
ncbi:hypothetical protein I3843_Q012000 [Carya illinoinensis]|nr:hypothetical protein I3843_Q012000 [Carya illinoinensis]